MKKIPTKLILGLVLAGCMTLPMALAPSTYANTNAAYDICNTNVSNEVKDANGCFNNANTIDKSIEGILEAVIGIAGIIAAIYIVVGGVNYMTSAGDAGKIQKAKNTILYALIGLIVCALAYAIVNWTIGAIG